MNTEPNYRSALLEYAESVGEHDPYLGTVLASIANSGNEPLIRCTGKSIQHSMRRLVYSQSHSLLDLLRFLPVLN